MRLLISLLIISTIIHIGILLLPAILPMKEPEKKEVVIELQQIEIPKPKPKPLQQGNKPKTDSKVVNNNSTNNNQEVIKKEVAAYKPMEIPNDLVLPDIEVPTSLTDVKAEIAVPSSIQNQKKDIKPKVNPQSINKELASLEAQKSDIDQKNKDEDAKNAKKGLIKSDGQIYSFDVLPSNNRNLSYIPPEPEFALENDAKVTLKFSIDKNGNTSDIIFVTRNDSRVESMAYDYVRFMRFEAVLHDEKDTAQITLTFKVRK